MLKVIARFLNIHILGLIQVQSFLLVHYFGMHTVLEEE